MKGFTLILRDSASVSRVDEVSSFVGVDDSGSFGILSGHARFMTCLQQGFARFRQREESWEYLAMPGAVLYFKDDILSLSTRKYYINSDYERITEALALHLLAEEQALREVRQNLVQLEQEIMKQLWKLDVRG